MRTEREDRPAMIERCTICSKKCKTDDILRAYGCASFKFAAKYKATSRYARSLRRSKNFIGGVGRVKLRTKD